MAELRHLQRFDVQTNSVALPPNAAFVAYMAADGIVVDDGKRRLFRGTKRRIHRSSKGYVMAATDAGVLFSDVQQLGFVSLTGDFTPLLQLARFCPTHLHVASATLTALRGAELFQFDAATWKQKLHVDLSEDLDIAAYTTCSFDGENFLISTQGQFVVLDSAGAVETIHSANRRHRPFVCGDRLVAERMDQSTIVTDLLTDETRETHPDETHPTWCSSSGEMRAASGPDILVRIDGIATRYTAGPAHSQTRSEYVQFADTAPRVARWFLHAKQFDVFEW